jgi:hypothetical protein
MLARYCRSGVAYRDVGEGREQDAEASPPRLYFVLPLESRRGRRSYRSTGAAGVRELVARQLRAQGVTVHPPVITDNGIQHGSET